MKTIELRAIAGAIVAVLLCVASGSLWAGTEGASSTFYGQGAGASGSGDAGLNTFVGLNAGNANTTGNASTFIGGAAGYRNTTGFSNTFVGALAGSENTSGFSNTFVGSSAGVFNTTGANNVFVGDGVGNSNTTGSMNTIVGTAAGVRNTTGNDNVFFGANVGQNVTEGSGNTFVGSGSGNSNTVGNGNTFVGMYAGSNNATGYENTIIGTFAGASNVAGHGNVFLGDYAGSVETGSNKLYIDNCADTSCVSPLIYGEFDNHLLNINGVTSVAANNAAKSQMHLSLANADSGGFLTSVAENNLFMSSGARFDSGHWVQRSSDGNAVMAGSGGVGYRIFTHTGSTVGSAFTPTVRLHIDYDGNLGLNQMAVAGTPIQHSSGAHLTSGGVWTDASSRSYKEHIAELSTADAMTTLAALTPVTYNYKIDGDEKYVGFIAEDVPELVARKDRKSLSPMDIVAVLTKVVQEQKQSLDEKSKTLESVLAELAKLRTEVAQIKDRGN